jgi:hypothetical protein
LSTPACQLNVNDDAVAGPNDKTGFAGRCVSGGEGAAGAAGAGDGDGEDAEGAGADGALHGLVATGDNLACFPNLLRSASIGCNPSVCVVPQLNPENVHVGATNGVGDERKPKRVSPTFTSSKNTS